ncbi:DUF1702 family protein [Micromonospora sonneratiae]|uniref:DUF1702 family protein n=1 Tax=Micromonospora sonneratiae TaxID=1184706 RepID=A0ABW3YJX6_9ACTN
MNVRPTGWRRLLALSTELVDFDARGFRTVPSATRAQLESAAGAFIDGFNLELAAGPVDVSGFTPHTRGLAAEGAAMAAVLLDRLSPRPARHFPALLREHGQRYSYLLYVGAGWAMAKLRYPGIGPLHASDPLLCWLAYDGYGFCRGFFASRRALNRWRRHPGRCDAVCAIRYQGLGRSMWFRECADPSAIAAVIASFPTAHRGDLWSGVALASVYAGGVPTETYPQLRRLAGTHGAALAQGAAFGAEAWQASGHPPEHAFAGVLALTGVDLREAAEWTWQARDGLDRADAGPRDYARWRARIQQYAAEKTYR